MKGKLIVIDGTDGSGKATQTRALVRRLRQTGRKVYMADFPQYGCKSAGMVEEYLNGKYGKLNPRAASIFYAVDRFDASFVIRRMLSMGRVVIANRYVTANAGHQGGKIADSKERKKFFDWLEKLEFGIFKLPRPDLTIVLHVPAKIAQKLVDKKSSASRAYAKGKKRDLHEADINHLKNAEKVYLEMTNFFPKTKLIKCVRDNRLLSPAEIHEKVWSIVSRILMPKSQF